MPNTSRFKQIVHHLESAFQHMDKLGLVESGMLGKYAEYIIAKKLEELGYTVQIGFERNGVNSKNADIFLPVERIRVEVKSSTFKFSEMGWSASFRTGTQIINSKFDACVFITFSPEKWWKVENIFVFTLEELKEISVPRYNSAAHKNNACLLFYHGHYANYSEYLSELKSPEYRVEIDLHKYPENFEERWDKIKDVK